MIAVPTLDTNWDVIELGTGKTLGSARLPRERFIQDAALTTSPYGLACLSAMARQYSDILAGRELWSLSITNLGFKAKRLAISPDGRRATVASGLNSDGSDIVLLEAGSGRLILRTNLPGTDIGGIAFSPDSRLLAEGVKSETRDPKSETNPKLE